jgi:uncharacterized metal-binding protein
MPGAQTHDAITVVTGLTLAPVSYSGFLGLGFPPEIALRNAAILAVAHLVSGILFSPDLDIDSAIDNRWGIFYWIWRPYMWIVPHRSRWLSHGLILPPLLRLAYFYYILVALLVISTWLLAKISIVVPDLHVRLGEVLIDLARDNPRETGAFLLGFITGSAAHSIADWLVTGGKRFLRNLGIHVVIDYSNHDRWRPPYRRRSRTWDR